MGGGTIYKALSKIEAKHPGTVAIPSSTAQAVSRSANRDPQCPGEGRRQLRAGDPLGRQACDREGRGPRPVVSIRRADAAHAAEAGPKLSTRLRHSMSDYLDRVDHRAARGKK